MGIGFKIWSWCINKRYQKDVARENNVLLLTAKIIHIVAFSVVIAGLITLIILSIIKDNNSFENVQPAFFLYWSFFGFVQVTLTVIMISAFLHLTQFNTYRIGIFYSRIVKVFVIVFLTAVIVIAQPFDRPLIEFIPLIIVDGIALILLYPTEERWREWTRKCPRVDGTD